MYPFPWSSRYLLCKTDTVSQAALKSRGVDKLLEEARDDNRENDAVYLGRKCRSLDLLWI